MLTLKRLMEATLTPNVKFEMINGLIHPPSPKSLFTLTLTTDPRPNHHPPSPYTHPLSNHPPSS